MENKGYEEEQQQAAITSEDSPQLSHFSRTNPFSPPSSNSHTYEEVLPGIESVSKSSQDPPIDPRKSTSNERVAGAVSPEAARRSLPREASPFRRNFTLPFRRATDSSVETSSVRVTSREKNGCVEKAEIGDTLVDDASARATQSNCRPNRRRRKKDCKHCRNKARETVLEKNRNNEQEERSCDSQSILDPRNLEMLPVCPFSGKTELDVSDSTTVFTIAEKMVGAQVVSSGKEDKALIAEKNRNGMRVNSMYSQDRWYTKEAPMFFSDVKEDNPFQRAYSLPVRTQTASSQNRINLRRSVRGEPPPHPARLRKHRHGWTLHLAHPLEAPACTKSLLLLLILLLALLGIGAVALYIVFEPEKLQIIQQYLRSSLNGSRVHAKSGKTLNSTANEQNATLASMTTPISSTLLASAFSSVEESRNESSPVTEAETAGPWLFNSTRYCDDCVKGEVCVALLDEDVPICRTELDHADPTGCAGFCLINKQRCHRLDVDAFRCVQVEHYCLDDEWTCINTLCIPLEKHCDGHMNCYDHSDEYNCVCDQETHFQCGNETSCLPLEKRCDGKIDCWDAADEINCTLGRNLGRSCPSENEFTCSDGQCILRARFCDGLSDCVDGSDEPHGCQGRCNQHEFTCQNNRCITKGMKCNGVDDCGDGSDERHCKDRFF